MAGLEDIGVISGIGNYSPSGGIIVPNASPYQKILSGSPEYRYFTAPLSNKGNATSPYGKNSIAVGPDTPVRLVDIVNGKVVYEGTGYDAASNAISKAQELSKAGGNKAGWEIQAVPPGSDSYAMVAREKVNPGTMDIALQVLSVAAQVGVAVATSGASLGVQMAAAGATAAAFTIAQGGSLGDAIKAGVMAAAPALGAKELGPLINKGLNAASPIVGKAIGAGVSSAAAGALTGQSLDEMAVSGVISGITTAVMPDVQKTIKSLGSSATGGGGGSSGGGAGGDIIVTGSTAPGGTIIATTGGNNNTTKTDATKQTGTETPENVLVEGSTTAAAAPTAGIGGTTGSDAVKQTGTETPENVLVEGQNTTAAAPTAGIGGGSSSDAVKQTGVETPENVLVEGDQKTVGVGPDLSLNMQDVGKLINSPEVQKVIDEEIKKDPSKKDMSILDWVRSGYITYQLIKAIVGGGGSDSATAGVGGGGVVPIVPLNRTQNVVSGGGQAGLGSYGFNPFTYGQAGGGQPEEYLFFGKPTTKSTGAGPAVTTTASAAPATAGIGAVPTTAGAAAADTTAGPASTDTTGGGGGSARLTLNVPEGGIGGGAPIILEGGNKGPATPANTGYTAEQLTGRQNYYELMRNPVIADYTSNINKTIAAQLNANKISQAQARGINDALQALYQTPGTTQDAIRSLATTSLRDATKAYAAQNPVARATAAQNPDSASYVAGLGPADLTAQTGVQMAEGGEAYDDMVKHLIEYRKGGGHHGPGPVKGIGSGQEDKIPAWLSDGEYVWSAQDVADLGDGSTDEGVRRLDKMRQMVRKRAGRKDVKKIAKPQRGIEDMLKAVGGRV